MALPDICFGKGLELNPVLNDAGFHMCRCATFVKPSKTFGIPAERIRAPVRGPGSGRCARCGRRYRRNPATCRRPAFVKLSGLSPEEDGSVPSAAKQSVGRFRLSADICPEDPISPSAFGSLFQ